MPASGEASRTRLPGRRFFAGRSVKSMIPNDFIQTLLSRVDIVDVIDRYVPLKKAGANYSACCPFHSEKTPSFTVSPTKQFYHCFGCGAHGTAIGFLMEYGGKAFPDAVEELARDAGLEVPRVERPGESERREQGGDLTALTLDAAKFYRAQLKECAARDRVPQGARPHRRDRRAVRHRLRTRRLAAARRRLRPLRRPGARDRRPRRSPATPASATTASATGSCSRSTTAAAR